jgi:hypothetical protein
MKDMAKSEPKAIYFPHRFALRDCVRHASTGESYVVIGLILERDCEDESANPCVGYRLARAYDGIREEFIAWEIELNPA